jgi:hypothetical protein
LKTAYGFLLIVALVGSMVDGIAAQAPQTDAPAVAPTIWTWSWDANVFVGGNYQLRKFRDFHSVESQNWLMAGGEHSLGGGRLSVHSMFSFEPFTVQALGSPQVFQTGETYQGAPLIDYQHPHDLFMDLGVTWTRTLSRARLLVTVAPVGSPALGPVPFMHRPSAAENPTAPLGHHQMDATHITHGVITAGIEQGAVRVEGSWFNGREPDENRKDIELRQLDSYSGRLTWKRQGWEAQVSAAHLTTPEYVEPFSNVTRLTASIGHTDAGGRVAALLAWGQNREIHGNMDAYLFEATLRPRARHAFYTRTELNNQGHPESRRPPSTRIRALSPAVTSRRTDGRLRVRHRPIPRRPIRPRRRRDLVPCTRGPARQLRQPRIVSRVLTVPAASPQAARDARHAHDGVSARRCY